MQLILIALVLGIFVHDAEMFPVARTSLSPWQLLGMSLVLKAGWALLYAASCRLSYAKLRQPNPGRTLRRLDRLTSVYRLGAVMLYFCDLALGLLDSIREQIHNSVLVDELILLVPTLAMFCVGWWAYYPIDRRLREASLIRRIDQSQPIYPIQGRWSYVLTHLRHEVALIMVPVLLVMAWVEIVPPTWPVWGLDLAPLAVLAGAALIFLFAPTIIRYVWDTVPLPDGEIRQRMMDMCRLHRVHIRDVLLWQTTSGGAGMINAAVMGLIGPLRYILLTDGLLDQLPEKHVEAVMAHELAHVRKHHMFWLLAAALATLGLTMMGAGLLSLAGGAETPLAMDRAAAAGDAEFFDAPMQQRIAALAVIGVAMALWAAIFGWVSRRIERQADAFAVQHLSCQKGLDVIDSDSAMTMVTSLQQVADLNHLPTDRRNWRHGSIAWRQEHLHSLIGQPRNELAIDRLMGRVKMATLVAIAVVVAGFFSFEL